MRALIAAALTALAGLPPVLAEAPPRVVSMDYCADQYVLGLAERGQIAAVTVEAGQDYSAHRDLAAGLPTVRAVTEDVIALRPDLVVRSYSGDARQDALFARLGIETHQIGYAPDFETLRDAIRAAAAAMGRAERGEQVIADMDAALAEAGRGEPVSALYVTPGGVTTAGGGLVHEMILAAGLTNHAHHAGGGWIAMPLERLVAETPDLILTGFFTTAAERVNRWSAGRHPVMRERLARTPTLDLDAARLSCGGWHLADGAVAIRRAADAILNGGAP